MNRGVRLFCLQGKASARLLLGCGQMSTGGGRIGRANAKAAEDQSAAAFALLVSDGWRSRKGHRLVF